MNPQETHVLQSMLAAMSPSDRRALAREARRRQRHFGGESGSRARRHPARSAAACSPSRSSDGRGSPSGSGELTDLDPDPDDDRWPQGAAVERIRRHPKVSIESVMLELLRQRADGCGRDADVGPLAASGVSHAIEARVVGVAPGIAWVASGGEVISVPVAADLVAVQRTALAVGDRAVLAVDPRSGRPTILREVLPRRSWLARSDPHLPAGERVLAANIDLGLVVVTLREPVLRPALIDRMLVRLQQGAVQPVVVVNKIDLVAAADRDVALCPLQPYREIAVTVLAVSARTGEGLAELRELLAGRTAVLLGHSGVGKTSLLEALMPGSGRAVGAVNRWTGKGRHTTTAASLIGGPGDTAIIDTPGIRKFGLGRLTPDELLRHFPEFGRVVGHCRFADCQHRDEPDCAVRAALATGEVAVARYRCYRRLLGDGYV